MIGYHTGSLEATRQAWLTQDIPFECAQVWLGSPMAFKPTTKYCTFAGDYQDLAAHIRLYAHAPYVVSMNHKIKSYDSVYRHLEICDYVGIRGLVVHTGSWTESNDPVETWVEFLKQFSEYKTPVLLENMAYKNAMTGDQLNQVGDQLRGARICLDTAHSWAGRVRPSDVNPEYVKLIHLNDTKVAFGSNLDRHSEVVIGEGLLGSTLNNIVSSYPAIDCIREVCTEVMDIELAKGTWKRF